MESNTASSASLPPSLEDVMLGPKQGGVEVYLIRHADALPDAAEVVLGHYDEQSLSELGRKQAQALAAGLRDVKLAAVYSAPLGRARQTAAPLAEARGLEVQIEPGLREVGLGPLHPNIAEGASPQEYAEALKVRLREIAAIAIGEGGWGSIPGAEPSAALRERMTAAVSAIVARHPGESVALVSHAGAINAYFAAILGLQRDYFFPTANTSISVVRVKGANTLVMALNDIAHLRAAGLFPPKESER
jgi:2,3-bisphosphoglycerate-dependent phosphoglycerate mutase